jgi:hypothetical protein
MAVGTNNGVKDGPLVGLCDDSMIVALVGPSVVGYATGAIIGTVDGDSIVVGFSR